LLKKNVWIFRSLGKTHSDFGKFSEKGQDCEEFPEIPDGKYFDEGKSGECKIRKAGLRH